MADNFGLKIGLEGEKEFKNALASINQQFKVLGSEMTLVKSEFDKNDQSADALAARHEVLSKQVQAQAEKVEVLRAALSNAATSFGENDKRTQNWQIQLNNAEAALNDLNKELAENKKKLDDVDDGMEDTGDGAEELADDLDEAEEESEDAKVSFEGLGNVCKAAGAAMAAAFAAVSAAAVAAGKALVDMSKAGAAYADNVITASTVTGLATDKLQEYQYASELIDVSVDTLTGSMTKNIKSMKSAADGSKSFVEAYDQLGISIVDANGNMRDGEEVYWEIIDSLGKMENETERDALAMTLLGKSARDLNPLIEAGASRMQELGEQAHQAGYVLGDEVLEAYGAFDDQMQYLAVGSEAAKNALGTILLPMLTQVAGEGVSLLGEFTNGVLAAEGDMGKIADVIGEILPKALNTIMQYIPDILNIAVEVVSSFASAIASNLPMLVETASSIIFTVLQTMISALPEISKSGVQLLTTLVDGIIANLPLLIEAGLQMITTIVTGIANYIPLLIPSIVELVVQVAQTLINNLPLLLDALLQLVMGLVQGVVDAIPILLEALPTVISSVFDFIIGAIPQLMEAVTQIFVALVGMLPELITSIITFLLDSIPMIIETGITLITSLVDALPTIIEAIVAAIPLIIEGIVTAVLQGLPKIIQAGIDLLISLVQALPQIITTIVSAIPDIILGIVKAVILSIPQIIQAGIELFVSLIENLPTIIIEIVKAVPQIITGLVTAFTDSIPKIATVGKNIIEGLWEGIKNMGKWIKDKVSDFFGGIVDGVKGLLGIHSPSTVFAGIGENMGAGIGVGFEDAMRRVEKDMQKAIPTEFDVNSSLNGLLPTDNPSGRSINVTIPLTIDGHTLARILSEIQWTQNAVFVRNLGTA